MINAVKYLSDPGASHHFRDLYLSVRKQEGRLFSDAETRDLPYLPDIHPLHKEWLMRADTMQRFLIYLGKKTLTGPLLDLGCGNGWFASKIVELTGKKVIGLDVNTVELEQAARVFQKGSLSFSFGDIFEDIFPPGHFEMIVLNASAQYFPDIAHVIDRCLYFLKEDGEIHLLDTHFYRDEKTARQAAERTRKYYSSLGFAEMSSHYHHHQLIELEKIEKTKADILFNNSKLNIQLSKLLLRSRSPFPWVRIRRRTL